MLKPGKPSCARVDVRLRSTKVIELLPPPSNILNSYYISHLTACKMILKNGHIYSIISLDSSGNVRIVSTLQSEIVIKFSWVNKIIAYTKFQIYCNLGELHTPVAIQLSTIPHNDVS